MFKRKLYLTHKLYYSTQSCITNYTYTQFTHAYEFTESELFY